MFEYLKRGVEYVLEGVMADLACKCYLTCVQSFLQSIIPAVAGASIGILTIARHTFLPACYKAAAVVTATFNLGPAVVHLLHLIHFLN